MSQTITEEEYYQKKHAVDSKVGGGTIFCSHLWKQVQKDQRLSVRIKRTYGETNEAEFIRGLWKCIKCGKVAKKSNNWEYADWGCFIATAAYGSPLAPQLNVLRQFRDACMPTYLINLYYKLSPPLASQIRNKNHVRLMIRHFLEPFVKLLQTCKL